MKSIRLGCITIHYFIHVPCSPTDKEIGRMRSSELYFEKDEEDF